MEFKKNHTIYLQIADFICENILSGKLNEGERLESVREMATQVQVNPNTVMRTFSYLQEKEIIFNKRGVGNFVSEDALKKIKLMKKEEFVRNYLPDLFKMMDLLEVDFKELKEIYLKNKKQ